MATHILPPPNTLGAPDRYDVWRENQSQAVAQILASPKRFVGVCAPTGSGKSLIAWITAKLHNQRALFISSTKELQSQYMDRERGFGGHGLVNIMGQNNYECIAADYFGLSNGSQRIMVDAGPCHFGAPCPYKKNGCLYFDMAIPAAKRSDAICTNYSYRISNSRSREDFARVTSEGATPETIGVMIADEAHNAFNSMTSFLSTCLKGRDFDLLEASPLSTNNFHQWTEWAAEHNVTLEQRITALKAEIASDPKQSHLHAEATALRDLSGKLTTLATAKGEWIVERDGGTIQFDPVWPGVYAESLLWRSVPHNILMSATLTRKTMQLLGIAPDDFDFFDFPSTFPIERRRVYHLKSGFIKYNTSDVDLRLWMMGIDNLIRTRSLELGWKTIIHSVSYERMKYIKEHSQYGMFMTTHTSRTARETVARFRSAPSPAILVSPAITEGIDLPDDMCRLNILAKMPFPNPTSAIMKARAAQDAEYMGYIMVNSATQATGRSTRSELDWSESFICDDSVWSYIGSRHRPGKYRHLFSQWWLDGYMGTVDTVPPPCKF